MNSVSQFDWALLTCQMKEAAFIFFYLINVKFILLSIKAWNSGTALAPLVLMPHDAFIFNALYIGLVLFLYTRKGKKLLD